MNQDIYLYAVSFTASKEAGIALVAAYDDRSAFQILKNGGSRNSDSYSLQQVRNIGVSAGCTFGLLMESYVNAREAYDAIVAFARTMVGPKGDKGDKGDTGTAPFDRVSVSVNDTTDDPSVYYGISKSSQGDNVLSIAFSGLKGRTGNGIVSLVQTNASNKDGGLNEWQATMNDGRVSKFYVKNGETGVRTVNATIDSLPGNPRVVTSLSSQGDLEFSFFGLKGIQGEPGVNNTTIEIIDSISSVTPSEDTTGKIYYVYNAQTDEYDRYYTHFNGTTYGFVQIGDTSLELSDYKRKDSEVWLTQEEFDAIPIKDSTKTYNIYEEVDWIIDDGNGGGEELEGDSGSSGSSGYSPDLVDTA